MLYSQPKVISSIKSVQQQLKALPKLPKIIWLYTEYDFNSEKMIEQIFGYFIQQKARESQYTIRHINAWSSYEWLSN